MNGLERQHYIREQRERIMAEARASVDRLRNLRPQENSIGNPIDPLAKWRAEAEAQERARADNTGMVYKTHDAPVAPAAPTPASDTTDDRIAAEREFVLAVVAEALGELSARYDREIASLRDKVDCYIRTPDSMVDAARELSAQTAKALAAVADLRAASERDQQRRSDPLDLPALPLRRPN